MKKILVVEDDKYLRDVIVEKLKKENYDVIEAIDGETGWQMTVNNKPDLVVLDIILPVLNGFDYLARVKKDQEVSKIPVIILSNLGQVEDIERGKSLGAKDYMVKAHFTPTDLVNKVKQYV